MKLLIYIIPSVVLMVVMGCATLKEKKPDLGVNAYPLTIIQGEKRIEMYASDTIISISKKPFMLEFVSRRHDNENKLFYSTQIATTRDSEAFNDLSIGPIPKEHSLFGYATGNAGAAAEEYGTMYIDDNGHHFIFYAGEDDKRATLVETLNDGTIRLKWTINSFTEDGVTSEISTVESSEFYLLFLQDFNLNDTIEAGELKKLHILIN